VTGASFDWFDALLLGAVAAAGLLLMGLSVGCGYAVGTVLRAVL